MKAPHDFLSDTAAELAYDDDRLSLYTTEREVVGKQRHTEAEWITKARSAFCLAVSAASWKLAETALSDKGYSGFGERLAIVATFFFGVALVADIALLYYSVWLHGLQLNLLDDRRRLGIKADILYEEEKKSNVLVPIGFNSRSRWNNKDLREMAKACAQKSDYIEEQKHTLWLCNILLPALLCVALVLFFLAAVDYSGYKQSMASNPPKPTTPQPTPAPRPTPSTQPIIERTVGPTTPAPTPPPKK